MTPAVQSIIKAAIALQVAALEWEEKDVSDHEAHKGIEAALKAAEKAVKKLVREQHI